MISSRDALELRSDGALTVKEDLCYRHGWMLLQCEESLFSLTAHKADVACFRPCLAARPVSPPGPLQHTSNGTCLGGSYKRRNAATQRTNATILRADTFTSIRCGQRTKASYLLRNFLCHVNQDKIVTIVSGSEITQYIQIFSETTQASG